MDWLNSEKDWIIEVDITFRCNLACRHCNRLCNSERKYNIVRENPDMKMQHIEYLLSEIQRFPKGKIQLIRIIGGEPLLSPILLSTVQKFELLLKEDYIKEINIVSNGTIPIPNEIRKYIVFSPQIIGKLFENQGVLSKETVMSIKNEKHRNITIVPNDFNQQAKICDLVLTCGINYSIYGFSLCAPCLPAMIVFSKNHNKFLSHIPLRLSDFVKDNYSTDVCNNCNFAFKNKHQINRNESAITGKTWKEQINDNLKYYREPNFNWIDEM